MEFEVRQDSTPSGTTPWYSTLADQAKVEFADTALSATTLGQVLFRGLITHLDIRSNDAGVGTITRVSCTDVNNLLDKLVVYKGRTGTAKNQPVFAFTVAAGKTDKQVVQAVLTYLNAKADSTVKALFDPSVTAGITATTGSTMPKMEFQLGTLRAALDSIAEEAQALDGKRRRYYVDTTTSAAGGGRLVWGLAEAAAGDWATAPIEMWTSEIPDNPDPSVATGTGRAATGGSSTAASKMNPAELSLSYDHDGTSKIAYILTADGSDKDTNADPYSRTYTAAGFTARSGALISHALVQAPAVRGSDRTTKVLNVAKAHFASAGKPMLTIQFKVNGAGTKDWNAYGFAAGWRQTGASSYGFVDRWAPGQQVLIVAPEQGLTYDAANRYLSLYRIEEVTMSFQGESWIREFEITAGRRPRGSLSSLVAAQR